MKDSFFILYGLSIFFLALKFINSLNLDYSIVYVPKTIKIIILSDFFDKVLLYFLLALSIALLSFKTKTRKMFYFIYLSFFLALITNFFLYSKEIEFLMLSLTNFLIFLIKFDSLIHKLKALTLFFTGIFLIPLIIEFGSALTWFLNIFMPVLNFESGIGWNFVSKEIELSNILFSASFYFIYPILFSWAWILAFQSMNFFKPKSLKKNLKPNNRMIFLFLILLSIIAIILAYYPYFFRKDLVGVDTKWYYNKLNELNSRNDLIEFFLNESHSLYLLILFFIKKLTNFSSLFMIKIGPALLLIFLIISAYSMVKNGTGNENLSILSSIFACFSYYTTVGMVRRHIRELVSFI